MGSYWEVRMMEKCTDRYAKAKEGGWMRTLVVMIKMKITKYKY